MTLADSRRALLFRRACAVLLGLALSIGGLLGLSKLLGAGGGVGLLVIKAYGVVAVGAGGALLLGGLVRPRSLRRIVVVVFQVCAVVVLLTSLVAASVGVMGGGELAPLFFGIGVGGGGLALLLGAAAIAVQRRQSRIAATDGK